MPTYAYLWNCLKLHYSHHKSCVPVQFSSRRNLCACKSPCALHLVSEKFPQHWLWNSSRMHTVLLSNRAEICPECFSGSFMRVLCCRRNLVALGPRMSKEERRQLFEAQVKAEDEMNAELQRQQEALMQQQQAAAAYLFQQDPAFAALHGLAAADPSLLAAQGQGQYHTPSITFRHYPPNCQNLLRRWWGTLYLCAAVHWHFPPSSASIHYTTDGALFISVQLSTDTFLQNLPVLVTPLMGHSLSPCSCPLTLSAPSERFGYQ